MKPFEDRVLGHEIAGVIESFGSKVDVAKLGLSVGDPVLVYPWIGCGDCSVCNIGSTTAWEFDVGAASSIGVGENPGGYSTHVPVPRCSYLIKLPQNIPADVGCMLPCSGVTTFTAIKKTQCAIERALEKFGEARLLIVGAGGLGLWTTTLSKVVFKGKKVSISVADVSQKALEIAKGAGADETILLDPKDGVEASSAKVTKNGQCKIDAAIDLVGRDITSGLAVQSLRKEGLLTIVGLFGGALTAPIPAMVFAHTAVQGTLVGNQSTLQELVDLVSKNELSYPSLETYHLEQVNDVLDRLRAGQVKGRALLKF